MSALTELTELWLHDNGLDGDIPDLSTLTKLTKLYLNTNQLTGSIPDLSTLTNLTALSLSTNRLTGTIPTWLNELTKLEILSLHTNQLTGEIPDLSNLDQLTELYLSRNQLTGTIPTWLNELTKLTHLYLHTNQLTGEIPDLSALINLEKLYLNDNGLEGSIPDLSALIKLEYLYLRSSQLTGSIPDLSALTKLTRLDLRKNALTGEISNLNLNAPDLEWLLLSRNAALTGPIPMEWGELAKLKYLWLHDTDWEGAWPEGVPQALRDKAGLNLRTNRRPVAEDQTVDVTEGLPFEYSMTEVFSDPDGDTLRYHATRAGATPADDTDLPGWLMIGIDTGTLSGTPPVDFVGQRLAVRVSATDEDTPPASPTEDMPFCDPARDVATDEVNPPPLCASVIVTLSGIANQPDDPPSEPWVSIELESSSTEGNPVTFTLTRGSDDITRTRMVNVSVSESGDMLSGSPPMSVVFAANSATATLVVETR